MTVPPTFPLQHKSRLHGAFSVTIENDTAWDSAQLVAAWRACLQSLGLDSRGGRHRLAVRYHRRGHRYQGTIGRATIGGRACWLWLPHPKHGIDIPDLWKTMHHEALHLKGAMHGDMTPEQRWCRGSAPSWSAGLTLTLAAPEPVAVKPSATERAEKQLTHARAMLKRAETRLKRATTLHRNWGKKVRRAERMLERAATPPPAVESHELLAAASPEKTS